jgi:hypothetical protein
LTFRPFVDDELAQVDHLLAVDREEVGVHVDVVDAERRERYCSSSKMSWGERTRTLSGS